MVAVNSDDGLAVEMPSDTQVLIRIELAIPRELAYTVWTTPELIKKWWGAGLGEVRSIEADLRVGGAWRYVIFANDSLWGFHGEYLEVVPNERLLTTEIFENQPEAAIIKKVTFTEKDGRTVLETLVQHTSKEFRDAQVDPHWQQGLKDLRHHLEQAAASVS